MEPRVEQAVLEQEKAKVKWMAQEMGHTRHSPPPAAVSPPSPAPLNDLGPLGPWAFGRTEWNPTAGLTGVRQVVDRHSVTRFSPGDWFRHNENLIANAVKAKNRVDQTASYARDLNRHTCADLDWLYRDSSDRLQQRAQDVWRWHAELERAADSIYSEIKLLAYQPARLNRVIAALTLAKNVSSECIAIRCRRPETDLVRDEAHECLVKEASQINEVTALVSRCAQQVQDQQEAKHAALRALQTDWSCKAHCYRVDTMARAITTHQEPFVGLFQAGATSLPDNQVIPEGWEESSRKNISHSEAERARSVALRTLLEPLLDGAVRDIRAQASAVDDAVAKNVRLLAETIERMDEQYKQTVNREAAAEQLIAEMQVSVRATDPNLKTAQSRLFTRQERMAQENCRDPPQAKLLEEVSRVSAAASALGDQHKNAVDALREIRDERSRLEVTLVLKRRTLHLDRDRVAKIREYFPSSIKLSGMQ